MDHCTSSSSPAADTIAQTKQSIIKLNDVRRLYNNEQLNDQV